MGIGWVNADGKAGYSENEYDYTMQSMDNFRYTDQQRLEGSFQALGIAEPVQKPAPIQGEGFQVPAPETPGQAPPIAEPKYTPALGEPGQSSPHEQLSFVEKGFLHGLSAAEKLGLGGTSGKLYNDIVIRGRRHPITENDLSADDLSRLRSLVQHRIDSTGDTAGNVDYKHYNEHLRSIPLSEQASGKGTFDSNIFGGFKYAKDEKGNIKVTDTWDFNPVKEIPGADNPADQTVVSILAPVSLAASIGRKVVPPGKGVPVEVNLPAEVKKDLKEEIKADSTRANVESMTHSKVATNEPNPVAEGLKNFGKEVLWPPVRDMLVDTLQSVAAGVPPVPGMRVPNLKLPKAPSLPKNSAARDIPFPKDPTSGQLEIYNKRVAGSLLDEGTSLKAVNKATGIDETELKFMRDKRSLAASSIWGETPLHDLYRQRLGIDVNRPIKPSELKDFTMGLNSEEIGAVVKKMSPDAVADFERQLARNTLLNRGSSKKEIMDFMFPKKVPENKGTLMNRIEEAIIKAKNELPDEKKLTTETKPQLQQAQDRRFDPNTEERTIPGLKTRIRQIEYDRRLAGKTSGDDYPPNGELQRLRARLKELTSK